MREYISLHWRIITAAFFSVALVVAAYTLATGIGSPPVAVASTEAALLQALATRDSTGDGLPDWQKALYGIPLTSTTTDYFNLGMTNGEAVARGLIVPKAISNMAIATSSNQAVIVDPSLPPAPDAGTLTDAFARSFFALYLNTKANNGGVELTESQIDALTSQSLASIAAVVSAAPDYKSAADLTIAGSGPDALRAFAVSADAIIQKNRKQSSATKNEISYLQDVIEKNDVSAVEHISSLAKMYRDTAVGLSTLPVPVELSQGVLGFINAMMHASEVASDFARVNADPLATMFAISQYFEVDQSSLKAFKDIANVYEAAQVSILDGAPGAAFLSAINKYRFVAGSSYTP